VLTEKKNSTWGGRLAAIAIVTFIVAVLVMMFLAARGPQ
jgi:hypothetical protein